MENIILPSTVNIITDKKGENKGTITIEPCYYGYGTTLGNALRRVLLSSLPGAAVTSLKIKGVTHEFSTLENVKEDVLEIILNFKELRLRVFIEEPVKLIISAKGEKKITAGDINKSSDVEIINKDLHLLTLTDENAEFEAEITVSQGRGYETAEMRDTKSADLGTISVDSIFTPVRNVGYQTENVRVGQITNYDKVILNIETDGTASPKEVFIQAVRILLDHFNLLLDLAEGKKKAKKEKEEEEEILDESEELSAAEEEKEKEKSAESQEENLEEKENEEK